MSPKTPNDEIGTTVVGTPETVAVDVEHDKVGEYDGTEVTYPPNPSPKTIGDPFTLGG